MSDSYLLDAGWLFFAAWSVVVVLVGVAAFGRDFFPSKAPGNVSAAASDDRQTARSV